MWRRTRWLGTEVGERKGTLLYPLNLESYKFKLNSYNKDKGAKEISIIFFFWPYHLAGGIYPPPFPLPRPGIKPKTPAVEAWGRHHWAARKAPKISLTDVGVLLHVHTYKWQPTPVLLPGESCGRRSLVVYSPRHHKKLDMTEWLYFHFSLSCIGEGNGNPLQCSCLENPRDGGAWWAAIYGVAQSRTWLKRLSSIELY